MKKKIKQIVVPIFLSVLCGFICLSNNYIYYEDEGKYNTIIAITKNKDNIDKIKKTYNKELTIMEYLLKDEEMNNKLEAYDLELTKAQKDEDIKEVINKMINVYKFKSLLLRHNENQTRKGFFLYMKVILCLKKNYR